MFIHLHLLFLFLNYLSDFLLVEKKASGPSRALEPQTQAPESDERLRNFSAI